MEILISIIDFQKVNEDTMLYFAESGEKYIGPTYSLNGYRYVVEACHRQKGEEFSRILRFLPYYAE